MSVLALNLQLEQMPGEPTTNQPARCKLQLGISNVDHGAQETKIKNERARKRRDHVALPQFRTR